MPSKQCARGEIRRKSYKRKDGTRVKSTCIEDRGLPGKGPKTLPSPRKGTLGKFGYKASKTSKVRRTSLADAVDELGALPVFRKLNLVATFNKNSNPSLAKKFNLDKAWVKRTYMNVGKDAGADAASGGASNDRKASCSGKNTLAVRLIPKSVKKKAASLRALERKAKKKTQLMKLTKKELRSMARETRKTGYSKLRKRELVSMLL